MEKKSRVSDIIANENINEWKQGDLITIQAGTGQGKSYFIKNKLYEHAKLKGKKILMLLHRINCVNQFKMEIEKDNKVDSIEIMTYQKLEHLYKNKKTFDFSEYDYIVSDEFHYHIADASFNKYTDISLNKILEQSHAIRIFMSATGYYVHRFMNGFLKLNTIDYKLEISYDFIRKLVFFNSDDYLEQSIQDAINNNIKTIFFIQSATKAYDLHKKFKDNTLFNCGESDKHYKYVDKEKINNMLINERFEETILVTTTCLDAGVNLIDLDLTHIVCDVKDIEVLIQCIGRKRPQHEEDTITLCIKNIHNQTLGGMQTQLKKRVEMADFLDKHTVQEFVDEYPRTYDKYNIVYDEAVEDDKCTKKVNQLMRFKCKIDSFVISEMKSLGDFSYCKYIARLFGFHDEYDDSYNYTVEDVEKMKDELEDYLNGIVGEKLFSDEQQELSNLIIKELITLSKGTDYRTKKLKPTTLETIIRNQLNLPFAISKPKLESKGEMRGKRYIVITNLK